MKIISLVPSITKALFDLGLNEDEIIGRTKFCIHPEDRVKNLAVIGGTKNLNLEKIKALKLIQFYPKTRPTTHGNKLDS